MPRASLVNSTLIHTYPLPETNLCPKPSDNVRRLRSGRNGQAFPLVSYLQLIHPALNPPRQGREYLRTYLHPGGSAHRLRSPPFRLSIGRPLRLGLGPRLCYMVLFGFPCYLETSAPSRLLSGLFSSHGEIPIPVHDDSYCRLLHCVAAKLLSCICETRGEEFRDRARCCVRTCIADPFPCKCADLPGMTQSLSQATLLSSSCQILLTK